MSNRPPDGFARQLFEMERGFHERLLAEHDRVRRRQLYSDFYSRLADFMEEHEPGKKNWGSFSPELMQLMAPFVRDKTVLEFGCGYGFATFDLALYARQVIAADEARPMIAQMQARVAEKHLTTIEPVLLEDDPERALSRWLDAVDVLYSNDVVEHLHPDDLSDHLALAFRLLRPGGLYICMTPNRITGPHDVSGHFLPYHSKAQGAHIREYSHRELRDVFRAAGFAKFRTPVTAVGYHRLRSDAAYRRLLVPLQFKIALESLWFGQAKKHRPTLLNLFCLNKVVLFAWKP
jgi:SAM-dependent methyltransferase